LLLESLNQRIAVVTRFSVLQCPERREPPEELMRLKRAATLLAAARIVGCGD